MAIRSREGRIIDREFLRELGKLGKVKKEFFELSEAGKSCLMVGSTGRGKSLCLKRAYNDKLKETGGRGCVYIKESDLFRRFRDDDDAHEFLEKFEKQKPRHIYLDECFRPADWRDFGADRDKAKAAHMYYYVFWDQYISEAYWSIETVMGTANARPEDVIPQRVENDQGLLRRIREAFNIAPERAA